MVGLLQTCDGYRAEFWRRDIVVEEEVDRVIIYVDSDINVSDSEDTDIASDTNLP